jgi:DNA polymerase III subunit alpha
MAAFMAAQYVHLHTHSHYSFLEGLIDPALLARRAADWGMPAIALSDHASLTGVIPFYQACLEAGVKPILGLELECRAPADLEQEVPRGIDPHRSLVLLAMNLAGWSSLCRLSSTVLGDGATWLPFEALAGESQNLICLSGGRAGLLDHLLHAGREDLAEAWLETLNSCFQGSLYIELQKGNQIKDHYWALHLASLAGKLNLPVVATGDVFYQDPGDDQLQRVVTAIRLNSHVRDLSPETYAPGGAYLAGPDEMSLRFSQFPQALEATLEIATRCSVELPLGKPHYPEIELTSTETSWEILRQRAYHGARQHYGPISESLQQRLEHELDIIHQSGYSSLFLMMAEIIDFARREGIPFSSRGSAASSLVAYCLGITIPDPVRLNLYFERFLNPARATPPDIDTDLCSRRRDEVIQFVYRRFGPSRVGMVGTINRFRRRSALREVAKAYGLSNNQLEDLVKRLPYRGWGFYRQGGENESPYQSLMERYSQAPYPEIFEFATQLIGVPRHLSVHAGGMVIAPGELTDFVPTMLATKGVTVTQFDLESIEALGMIKIDLLGIRGLSVLGDVSKSLSAGDPKAVNVNVFPAGRRLSASEILESLPLEDDATSDSLRNAKTIGCFQIESPGMRATLKEIQAQSVDDLMVALALYRPGPLTGGLKEAFVRRHRGEEAVSQMHPALEPLLADTYGVILYQEQVLRIAHELAGLGLADADLLRRAMSHFDPGEQMRTLKEKFILGAQTRSGVPPMIGDRIWDLMAAFAGYGFPKAHAASYALVAWRAAWCKTHAPAVFMAAVLANWGGYYPQRVYLSEAQRMGLSVRPPDVNYARREFSVRFMDDQPVLFMGLDQVRDLTRRTQTRIMHQQPFRGLEDFLARVDPRPLEVENLAKAGALRGFGPIPSLLRRIQPGGWRGGQLSLFTLQDEADQEHLEDWDLGQRMRAQEQVLGVSVDGHPLDLFASQAQEASAVTTVEAAGMTGKRLRILGLRQGGRVGNTVQGQPLFQITLEDKEGILEVRVTGEQRRRLRSNFGRADIILVEGTVHLDETSEDAYLLAEKLWLLGS